MRAVMSSFPTSGHFTPLQGIVTHIAGPSMGKRGSPRPASVAAVSRCHGRPSPAHPLRTATNVGGTRAPTWSFVRRAAHPVDRTSVEPRVRGLSAQVRGYTVHPVHIPRSPRDGRATQRVGVGILSRSPGWIGVVSPGFIARILSNETPNQLAMLCRLSPARMM
jgi:hypothetical protein